MDNHISAFSDRISVRMEVVIFEGKEYTKASVLAARFRYTSDYLGQLCRGKKVDARLVGRAWYINLDSLNHHRDSRYKNVIVKSKDKAYDVPIKIEESLASKIPSKNYLSRIDVEPILKKKTVAIFKNKNGNLTEFPVKYETDDYSLIPRVNKNSVSRNVVITQADAEKLKVHKEEAAHTMFKAEPLPEVYMKGKISVAGLEEATEALPEVITSSSEVSKIEPEIKSGRKFLPQKPLKIAVRPLKQKTRPVIESSITSEVTRVAITSEEQPTIKPIPAGLVRPLALKSLPQQVRSAADPLSRSLIVKKSILPSTKNAQTVVAKQQPASVSGSATFKPRSVVTKESRKTTVSTSSSGWLPSLSLLVCATVLAVLLIVTKQEIFSTKENTQMRLTQDFSRLQAVVDLVRK